MLCFEVVYSMFYLVAFHAVIQDHCEVHMRLWLPNSVYKVFPLMVATIGILGCMLGSAAGLALGGVLLVYSGGVYCMRLQYARA